MLTARAGARWPPNAVRDLEQMAGILARLGARRDHAVVAGELPLDAQPPRDPPRARDGTSTIVQAANASDCVRQSYRATCASSWSTTARRLSSGQVSAMAESGSPAGACRTSSACCARGCEAGAPDDGRPCGRQHSVSSRVHCRVLHVGGCAREPPDAPPLLSPGESA